MAVKIKLKRMGKIREPYYRIVVADARTKRDGRAIEEIGKYHPKAEPSLIEVNSDRVQHWLSVGAQPTDPVCVLLKITGDWQRFKGLPGAEGTLRVAAPRVDKKDTFAAALAETLADGGSTTPKGKARAGTRSGDAKAGDGKAGDAKAAKPARADAGKADAAKADTGKADAAKAGDGKADAGKADAPTADTAKADTGKPDSAKAEADSAGTAAAAAEVTAAPADAAAGVTQAAPEAAPETAAAVDGEAAAEPGSGA